MTGQGLTIPAAANWGTDIHYGAPAQIERGPSARSLMSHGDGTWSCAWGGGRHPTKWWVKFLKERKLVVRSITYMDCNGCGARTAEVAPTPSFCGFSCPACLVQHDCEECAAEVAAALPATKASTPRLAREAAPLSQPDLIDLLMQAPEES